MKYTEITAPQFLNIVRRSREAKLIDILEKLDLYPFKTGEQSDVINYYSMKHVSMIANQLESGGLISISGTKGIDIFEIYLINLNKENCNLEDVIIADTGVWENIGTTLNISLTEIAEMKVSDNAIFVNPTFLTQKNLSPKGIFVIMPFAEEFTPVYADHIKKVAERLDLEIKRGDDFYKAQSIMQDVWDGIYNSRLLIADCTGKNPNIFYEIGLAHAIGKPVILITQEISDIPFDLAHMRIIEYKYTPPGMTEFETTLKKFVVEHYK